MQGVKDRTFKNWAETYSCVPDLFFEPKTNDDLKEILKMAHENKKKVKVVGCGHSPSSIACTDDYMIFLKNFDKIIDVILNCYIKYFISNV